MVIREAAGTFLVPSAHASAAFIGSHATPGSRYDMWPIFGGAALSVFPRTPLSTAMWRSSLSYMSSRPCFVRRPSPLDLSPSIGTLVFLPTLGLRLLQWGLLHLYLFSSGQGVDHPLRWHLHFIFHDRQPRRACKSHVEGKITKAAPHHFDELSPSTCVYFVVCIMVLWLCTYTTTKVLTTMIFFYVGHCSFQ